MVEKKNVLLVDAAGMSISLLAKKWMTTLK